MLSKMSGMDVGHAVNKLRVALVHDWLVSSGGGEKVLEDLHALFPNAPIYTLVYDKSQAPSWLHECDVRTTYLQRWPGAKSHHKMMLSFMPRAWEELDLSDFDVVISSCSSCCKGIITRPDAIHVCYCHSPIRYVWDMRFDYLEEARALKRMYARRVMHKIRLWDFQSAQRVDSFVANSKFVSRRIEKYYKRKSVTIHPGIDLTDSYVIDEPDDYYLFVGRLVRYKRADLAIRACGKTGKKLIVVGSGEEEKKLKVLAGSTVEFLGEISDAELHSLYAHAQALLFPGLEDFGLVPVEAMAFGCPVLAYGHGGATETVLNGKTGLFFKDQSVDSVVSCMNDFELGNLAFSRSRIHEYALNFSREHFRSEFMRYVERSLKERNFLVEPDFSNAISEEWVYEL